MIERAGYPKNFFARQGLEGWCQGVLGWGVKLLQPTTEEVKTWMKTRGVVVT